MKREKPDGPTTSRPQARKRVAFSAPKAATRAIIKRNAITSPLLRLPPEIRDRVWREVLGERLIHLKYIYIDDDLSFEDHDTIYWHCYDRSPWRHIVCEDDGPEDGPKKKWIPNPRYYIRLPGPDLYHGPHHDCDLHYEKPSSSSPINFDEHETMRLTVLAVSHQIYAEANHILWTTNTFSCCDGITFQRFMKTRTLSQKRLIRNLRFEMDWEFGDWKLWNKALSMPLVKSMIGLRTLRLNILYELKEYLWQDVKDNFLESTSFTEGLRKLSTLPLTDAEVAFRISEHTSRPGLWQKVDRDACAQKLREILLNPEGAEVYAEQQRRLKESSAMNRQMEANRASIRRPVASKQ
ncbi:ATP-dependent RNA helicase dbp6 [Physcia stellaris]|nr:ATP-dependent RNA helicase dbp6 [Physcia stellaris]